MAWETLMKGEEIIREAGKVDLMCQSGEFLNKISTQISSQGHINIGRGSHSAVLPWKTNENMSEVGKKEIHARIWVAYYNFSAVYYLSNTSDSPLVHDGSFHLTVLAPRKYV